MPFRGGGDAPLHVGIASRGGKPAADVGRSGGGAGSTCVHAGPGGASLPVSFVAWRRGPVRPWPLRLHVCLHRHGAVGLVSI